MDFRTEIDIPKKQTLNIGHDDSMITMLGSCFTDNIGSQLERDGFRVTHNPLGPLYNPESILQVLTLALNPKERTNLIIERDEAGLYHCLNFASRYTEPTIDILNDRINKELDELKEKIESSDTIILTFGTAYVFSLVDEYHDNPIVGNCHKFPANRFNRQLLTVQEVERAITCIINLLPPEKKVIFTVSPIRHLADGMHGNQISKATLQLGLHQAITKQTDRQIQYFPAYEIMLDDLRDYRFYAEDMKHPSPVAVDYIYEIFAKYYFTSDTIQRAVLARKQALRAAHRQILPNHGTISI